MIEAELVTVRVRDTLKRTQDHLHLKRNRRQLLFILLGERVSFESRSLAENANDLLEDRCRTGETELRLLPVDSFADLLESGKTSRRRVLDSTFQQNLRAVQADGVRQLLDPVEELVEVDRASERDVTEVSGTILIRVLAGRTDLAVLDDTEPRIKHAICNRLTRLICFVSCNLHDTPFENVVGVCDAKLNASDCVAHFTSYTVLCKVFVFTSAP